MEDQNKRTFELNNLMCAACANLNIEYITIHRGTLLCSYCLDDYLDSNYSGNETAFDSWLKYQRQRIKEDEEATEDE